MDGDLNRFLTAQQGTFEQAMAELGAGRKRTHWMWFIFPQIHGLGQSVMAYTYAIQSPEEARAYLDHPILGMRLQDACTTVTAAQGEAAQIMGEIDAVKLRSSATLFASVADDAEPYQAVLDRFFNGQPDPETVRRL